MNLDSFAQQLIDEIPQAQPRILLQEPMARHTTFRIGGPADLFFSAAGEEEVVVACRLARREGVPLTVLGNGSNLLVRDRGIRGMVLHLGHDFQRITVSGDRLSAQAGASLKLVAQQALLASLTGLEAISGIPGCVGGAVFMNAGAYGASVSDHLSRARLLDPVSGDITVWEKEDMHFGYRASRAMEEGNLVLSAEWILTTDAPAAIRDRMEDFTRRRREKQPLQYPSAGSVFKRPEGYFAGKLIEDAGLKGLTFGRAQVSPLHAGFIVNLGGATAKDVLGLIDIIKNTVADAFSVCLEPEIKILGE